VPDSSSNSLVSSLLHHMCQYEIPLIKFRPYRKGAFQLLVLSKGLQRATLWRMAHRRCGEWGHASDPESGNGECWRL